MLATLATHMAEQRVHELRRCGLAPIGRQTRTAEIRGHTFVLPNRQTEVIGELATTVAALNAAPTQEVEMNDTSTHVGEQSPLNGGAAPAEPGAIASFFQKLRFPTWKEGLIAGAVILAGAAVYIVLTGEVPDSTPTA